MASKRKGRPRNRAHRRAEERERRRAAQTPPAIKHASRLLEVFWSALPQSLEAKHRNDWPVVGPALLARCAVLVESILQLRDHELDAGLLTRSLWEHSLVFAWLAADPSRLPVWVKEDARTAVAAISELEEMNIRSGKMVSDGAWAQLERIAHDRSVPRLPKYARMAREADAHWCARLPEIEIARGSSWRALYSLLYRHLSAASAHPAPRGIARLISRPTARGFRVGRASPPSPTGNAITLAPTLFAHALLVSTDLLGWPSHDALIAAFEEYDDVR